MRTSRVTKKASVHLQQACTVYQEAIHSIALKKKLCMALEDDYLRNNIVSVRIQGIDNLIIYASNASAATRIRISSFQILKVLCLMRKGQTPSIKNIIVKISPSHK